VAASYTTSAYFLHDPDDAVRFVGSSTLLLGLGTLWLAPGNMFWSVHDS
jgi:hypothetical protein